MLLETTESLDPASSLAGPPLLHVPPNIPARACSIASSVYLACSALPGKILPLMSPLYAFPVFILLLPTLLRELISFLPGALIAFHMKPLLYHLSHILQLLYLPASCIVCEYLRRHVLFILICNPSA